MAERPIFIPSVDETSLVREVSIAFEWHSGMAPSQKRKNVASLHQAAARNGFSPLLEVSTKSNEQIGQRLSAFNVAVDLSPSVQIPLECAYQGSKVFEHGGPYRDIYYLSSRDAKRDPRLKNSGALVEFSFDGVEFPLTPRSAFYDWLYVIALYKQRDDLHFLADYIGFTDIEFNPSVSISCQARSCAVFVALSKRGLLAEVYNSVERYLELLSPNSRQANTSLKQQQTLFNS